jgi:hypothetical protein
MKKKFKFDLQRFASQVLTYDPRKVIVVFGSKTITGFAEDSMVTIAPHGEGMQLYSGADGEVARSIDPDHTFEITVHLSSASKSNTYLSNVYNADRQTGQFIQPLLIKDLGGDTLFSVDQAWVSNFPEATRSRNIETQDWVFQTGQVLAPIVGGND